MLVHNLWISKKLQSPNFPSLSHLLFNFCSHEHSSVREFFIPQSSLLGCFLVIDPKFESFKDKFLSHFASSKSFILKHRDTLFEDLDQDSNQRHAIYLQSMYTGCMKITKELFQVIDGDRTKAMKLFSENVEAVEIGISSYCNRVCGYCPNSFIDRRSSDKQMSDAIFFNLLNQLEEIDYSGVVTIHRYNEPFADFEYGLKRIKEIKSKIPNSRLQISTNGDYLDAQKLLLLGQVLSNRDSIHVTMHYAPKQNNFEKVLLELKKRVTSLGLDFVAPISDNMKFVSYKVDIQSPASCEYRAINFYYGDESSSLVNDRGGLLEITKGKKRVLPCFTTFTQIQIDFDGSLQPCCNVHSSVPSQDQYSMGTFTADSDVFLTFTSRIYVSWRKSMFTFGEKGSPCSTCTYSTKYDGSESFRDRAQIEIRRFLLRL